MMDVQPLIPWLSFIALLISVGTSLTVFLTSGAKKNANTLAEHGTRLAKVENDMKYMPDQASVHKLQLDLTEMKGHIGIITKSSEVTERTTRRVEEFLLSRKD